jgi:hypothetical protein
MSLAAALPVALASGCSTVTYSEDFDREVQVTPAATWAWQPLSASQERSLARISPFLQRRIERSVKRELDGRSFTLVSDRSSDYLISAYPILPDRTSRAAATIPRRHPVRVSFGIGVGFGRRGYRYPYRYGGWDYGFWPSFGYWSPYTWYAGWGYPYFGFSVASAGGHGRSVVGSGDRGPGTLVIDVIDAASGAVVWQGLAKGALLDMPSGDELDAYVDQVVRRTLEGFPPEGSE